MVASQKVIEWGRRHEPALWSFVFYLACRVLDMASSLPPTPGIPESNPFSRHADGTFWLSHSVVTYSVYLIPMVILSLLLYKIVERYDKQLADAAASIPWIYFGNIAIFFGAVPNLLIYFGLHVNLDPNLFP